MPLPFLIAGAAALVWTGLGATARSVNRDYEIELNQINEEMEEMSKEAEAEYRFSARRAEEAMRQWQELRKEIVQESMIPFAEVFGQLKGVEVTGSLPEGALQRMEQIRVAYSDNSRTQLSRLSESGAAWSGAAMGALGGGLYFVGSMFKGVKLQGEIEEAKATRARLKVELEAVKAKQAQLELITRRANELWEVGYNLHRLMEQAVGELDLLIQKAGTSWQRYTGAQKDQVMATVQLCDVLNTVLNAPLLDEEQKLDRRAAEVLAKAKAFLRQMN